MVVADPLRLTQVVDNLVTNALRYGGPNVHVSAARDGSHVRLTVSDDGPGIPDALAGSLFDAYVHGSRSHGFGGSGLGLMIVRQLCEAMSGTIELRAHRPHPVHRHLPRTADTRVRARPRPRPRSTRWRSGTPTRTSPSAWSRTSPTGSPPARPSLVAATPAHHWLLEEGLTALGIDTAAAQESGQYLPLDADQLHTDLPAFQHIDLDRFDSLIGDAVSASTGAGGVPGLRRDRGPVLAASRRPPRAGARVLLERAAHPGAVLPAVRLRARPR